MLIYPPDKLRVSLRAFPRNRGRENKRRKEGKRMLLSRGRRHMPEAATDCVCDGNGSPDSNFILTLNLTLTHALKQRSPNAIIRERF